MAAVAPQDALVPALRVTGLTRRYGDLVAVDDLSLEVRQGEILGFLGPNGAGKTTTLRMLCGLLRPHAGRVEILGQPLEPGNPAVLRRVGVSPQQVVVWETLTCLEQLVFMGRMYGLSRSLARSRSEALLAAFGLEEKAGKLARTLSGGMQRRLTIALALVHEPEILFLDEPQAGLDPQSRVLVREYVRSLAGRMTVVITTHDMEEAEKLSHRVCIVDRGRLLALDTVAAIKDRLGEGDVFELGAEGTGGAALAAALPPDLHPEAQEDGTVRFTTARGPEVLPAVLERVRARGFTVSHLRMRPRTLEDVFIRLTGRRLRE